MRRLEAQSRLHNEQDILRLLLNLMPSSALTPQPPLRNVARAFAQRKARCAVIQRDAQDPDFIAEHAAYYSKWTKPVPRFCTRVHFFSAESTFDDPLDLIDAISADGEQYLGFTTLRPVAAAPVAATIISGSCSNPQERPAGSDLAFCPQAGLRGVTPGTA